MAKRLNWKKAAQIEKAIRDGSTSAYDELPPTGSYADKKRFWKKKGYKTRPKSQTKSTITIKGPPKKRGANSRVLRRRKGQGVVELETKA